MSRKSFIPISILFLFLILLIIILIPTKKSRESDKIVQFEKDSIQKVRAYEQDILKRTTQLYNKIESAISDLSSFNSEVYNFDIPGVLNEADFFKTVHLLIEEGEASMVDSISNKVMNLRKKLISLQVKEFPKMRDRYRKYAKTALWEDDIKVKGYKTTIEFIGGIFAANKNKKEFYSKLENIFFKLRFKKIIFKWYDGDSEYTYYSPSTPNDAELIYY